MPKTNENLSGTSAAEISQVQALQQAVVELQSQLAFLEDTVDTLNQLVAQQSRELADQQRQLQLLYQQLASQTQGSQIQPFDLLADRPPHY